MSKLQYTSYKRPNLQDLKYEILPFMLESIWNCTKQWQLPHFIFHGQFTFLFLTEADATSSFTSSLLASFFNSK
jgi:hypothetical protein